MKILINVLDLFISMTVDNRNQDDEDGYSSQKMPNPNSKCDFKENDALSIQISPLEKVILLKDIVRGVFWGVYSYKKITDRNKKIFLKRSLGPGAGG